MRIICLSGYSQSGKSQISNIICNYLMCNKYEIGKPVYEELFRNFNGKESVENFVTVIENLRKKLGMSVLAEKVYSLINQDINSFSLVVGLRSIKDYEFLKNNSNDIINIFVYRNYFNRKKLIIDDLLCGESEANELINYESNQGIRQLYIESHGIIINDEYIPATVEEQVRVILQKFNLL